MVYNLFEKNPPSLVGKSTVGGAIKMKLNKKNN